MRKVIKLPWTMYFPRGRYYLLIVLLLLWVPLHGSHDQPGTLVVLVLILSLVSFAHLVNRVVCTKAGFNYFYILNSAKAIRWETIKKVRFVKTFFGARPIGIFDSKNNFFLIRIRGFSNKDILTFLNLLVENAPRVKIDSEVFLYMKMLMKKTGGKINV